MLEKNTKENFLSLATVAASPNRIFFSYLWGRRPLYVKPWEMMTHFALWSATGMFSNFYRRMLVKHSSYILELYRDIPVLAGIAIISIWPPVVLLFKNYGITNDDIEQEELIVNLGITWDHANLCNFLVHKSNLSELVHCDLNSGSRAYFAWIKDIFKTIKHEFM